MERFFRWWRQLREINWRELTPIQWGMVAIGALVVIWVVIQILQLALNILPFAIGLAALYFGYQWLQKRAENLPDRVDGKSKAEREVEAAVANVEAALRGDEVTVEVADSVTIQNTVVDEDGTEYELQVKQVINPETGFAEPDISRLVQNEEEKLANIEADKESQKEAINSQLEERRRRLLGED